MRTIKEKTTFKTEDGREFESEKAAKKHEALVVAKRDFEEAKATLGRILAENFATADGYKFEIGLRDYYWITPGYFTVPRLLKVDFWGTNWNWEEAPKESTTLVLLSYRDDAGEVMDKSYGRRISIDELYAYKDEAEKALLVRQREWLEERLAEVKEGKGV